MKKKNKPIFYGCVIFVIVMISVWNQLHFVPEVTKKEILIESKLPSKKEEKPKEEYFNPETQEVRVLIKTNGFQKIAHESATFSAEQGLRIESGLGGEKQFECEPGESISFWAKDSIFEKGTVCIYPKNADDRIRVDSLKRGYGIPSYRGKMEVFSTEDGIVIVNELPLEQYLYAVVPSEMPASFEKEALKAQAVCARSYAYNQMQDVSYPQFAANIDDSTSYQVYGNCEEQASTVDAVNETKGEKVWFHDSIATTYYYSTSCGRTAGIDAWGTTMDEAHEYLQGIAVEDENGVAYEKELPWYRWSAQIPDALMESLIQQHTSSDIGKLCDVTVTKRGTGDVAVQLVAKGDRGSVTVDTENKIRRALGGSGYELRRQDGSRTESRQLLPSAFFTIHHEGGVYTIQGGGMGHGIGMSQSGANEMAKTGKSYKEILQFFYRGIEVRV